MDAVSTPSMIGKRYQLLDPLGAGGMGTVHRVFDRLTRQTVALKRVTVNADNLLFASRAETTDVRLALAHEFKLLASLRHPYIISVLDYGFDEQHQPYYTMDLLEDAQTLIVAGQGKPRDKQIGLLIQLVQALAYLHRRGILHRDLKPANVLVIDDQVKVLDFGLSSTTREATGSTSGTLAYMAPEVLQGYPSSEASDMYAVGMMAYELLAGKYPFSVEFFQNLFDDILNTIPDVAALQLNPELSLMLNRLLAKSPEDRPINAGEIIEGFSTATGVQIPSETATTRESFLQAAQFVGREGEMTRLQTALSQAVNGRGSAWLIGGESGVGKSRFIDELRTQALVEGALVLRGQAVSEGGKAYQVWRDPLRRLVLNVDITDDQAATLRALIPDIFTLLDRDIADSSSQDSQVTQERLLAAIEDLFTRQQQPIVCILEDMHWAGIESVSVLTRLSRAIRNLPLLLVGSYRDDERPDLPEGLIDVEVLKLNRLNHNSIANLCASMLGPAGSDPAIVDLLQRETEGNAFFLVEVVRALAEEAGELGKIGSTTLPQTVFAGGVQLIVQRRLEQVPKAARPLLNLAAVAGRELDTTLLQSLDPSVLIDVWLLACADVAILEVNEGRWRFAHDKLREGLLATLPLAERQALHRKVAEAIENVYPDVSERAADLANHWGVVGDASLERQYNAMAGEQARMRGVNHDAIRFYERALALASDTRSSEQALIEQRLGEAYYGLGRQDESRHHLELALALRGRAMPTSPLSLGVGSSWQIGRQVIHRRFPSKAATLGRHEREAILEECRIHLQLQPVYGFNNEVLSYLYSNFYSLNLAERAGPSPELARLYGLATYGVGLFGLHSAASSYGRLARETVAHVADLASIGLTYESLAAYSLGKGNWDEASDLLKEAAARFEKVNNWRSWGEVQSFRAILEIARGNFGEATNIVSTITAVAIKDDDAQLYITSLVEQILLLLRQGKAQDTTPLIETMLQKVYPKMGDATDILVYGTVALARLRQGDRQAACEFVDKALEVIRHSRPVSNWTLEAISAVVETSTALQIASVDPDERRLMTANAQQSLKFLSGYCQFFAIGKPRKFLWQGNHKALANDVTGANKAWQQGLLLAQKLNMPYDEALLRYQIGSHLDTASLERDKQLKMAQEIFTSHGINENFVSIQPMKG